MGQFLVYYFKYHSENHHNDGKHRKVGKSRLMDTGLHVVKTEQTADPKQVQLRSEALNLHEEFRAFVLPETGEVVHCIVDKIGDEKCGPDCLT